jgi:hypothetical protein
MSVEKIVIEYSGWISVAKEDLKVVKIDENGKMPDVDTSNLTVHQIVSMLKKGDLILKSFGDTYSNDTIDGEESDFTFLVDED